MSPSRRPPVRRSRRSTRRIRPLSRSWSYPRRWRSPCSARSLSSSSSGCPAAWACRFATPRAMTMSPRNAVGA